MEPLKKESFFSYCKRLSEQIINRDDFVLVGVSLGGIISVELNKILQPRQTIIISSIATRHELPPALKFISLFKLHKLVPAGLYKWYNPVLGWYFGAETEREKELLKMYAKNASKKYMKWAVNEILNWKNDQRPSNLFHIHGTADRIFPYQYTHADVKIKGGTHLMVHNRADEISRILTERLNANPS